MGDFDVVKNSFLAESPNNYLYLITGVRGSGKSVFLASLLDYFRQQKNWVVLDCPFQDDLIKESLISLRRYGLKQKIFLESELSLNGKLLNVSIKEKTLPSTDYIDYLDLMTLLKKKGKRVLLTINEIALRTTQSSFSNSINRSLGKISRCFCL